MAPGGIGLEETSEIYHNPLNETYRKPWRGLARTAPM